ncbi:MAG: RNA polymerase sporulation sigma factor SigH [Tissierella sp.]|uniref:RNA polymerase sporulation sigma factor SigH n=1 Tax=Tissierella sp. TaxID=41274 RepID=UPI003F9C8E51
MTPGLYNDKSTKYEYMKDEDIVEIAKNGDSLALDYLINKYKRFVISKSTPYFLVGGEKDDIIQEGMIGLFNAIKDYNEDKLTPFIYFVEICIKRQIITAIKKATRKKHGPLNSYISLNKAAYKEETEIPLIEIIEENKISDPMEVYINGEEFKKMERKINSILSELEFKVFRQYLEGKTYEEISFEINENTKCIDNALQRIKRKFIEVIIK